MKIPRVIKPLLVIMAFIASVSFLISGCGDGSDSAAVPRTMDEVSASSAADSMEIFTGIGNVDMDMITGSDIDNMGPAQANATLVDQLEAVVKKAASELSVGELQSNGVLDYGIEYCDGGGTMYISLSWNGSALPTDPNPSCDQLLDFSMTMTMDNCIMELGDPTYMDGTMTATIPGSFCNIENGDPSAMNISGDFTVTDPGTQTSIVFASFSMETSNMVWDTNQDITGVTFVMNGSITLDNETVSFDDLNIDYSINPSTLEITMTMDGYIQTSCSNGWLHVSSDALVFSDTSPCPLSGSYTLTGADSEATIIFNGANDITITMPGSDPVVYTTCEGGLSCIGA